MMKKKGFLRFVALMMVSIFAVSMFTGCGKKEQGTSGDSAASSYEHAKDMLDVLWENTSKDMPAFGGNYEAYVENAPGDLDVNDTDTMTNNLLIPEDVQEHVTDAATLFHMMNANTFTGAALKLDGVKADDVAEKMKDSFKNNQFMCGIPDRIVIYTVGNDLVYFFGATDITDEFIKAAENLEGAKLIYDENY